MRAGEWMAHSVWGVADREEGGEEGGPVEVLMEVESTCGTRLGVGSF